MRGPRAASGDRDGRNRSWITGPSPSKSRATRKKIERLTDKQLKRAEKPYADKIKAKDSSPHFVRLGDGEAEYKLDRMEAEDAGVSRKTAKATGNPTVEFRDSPNVPTGTPAKR